MVTLFDGKQCSVERPTEVQYEKSLWIILFPIMETVLLSSKISGLLNSGRMNTARPACRRGIVAVQKLDPVYLLEEFPVGPNTGTACDLRGTQQRLGDKNETKFS